MLNQKNEWFKLNKAGRIFLYWYLAILLSSSLISASLIVFYFEVLLEGFGIDKISILACLIFPLFGSSIFYIRKLYKACINLDLVEPKSNEDSIRQSGIIFYFVLRPIFSIGFGLLLYLSMKIGLNTLIISPNLNEGFIYVCMFFSFFIGYSSGDVIDKFEKLGKNIVDNSFTTKSEN